MITSLCNLERFRRNRTGLIGRLCLVTLLIGVGWSQATGQVVQGQPGVWNGNPGNAQPGGYNAQGGAYSNGVRPGVNNGVQSNGPSRSGTDPRIASLPGPNTNVSYSNGAASTTGNPALGSTAAGSGGAGNGGKIPTKNLLQVFHDGGWMMYPIALCSFGLMVFAFERWIALRRTRVAPRHFVNRVIEQLQQQMIDRDEAVELCEKNDSPMARVMSAALKRYGRPAVEVEQAVLDAGERECNLLRRNMRAILAISNLSPLLGLLGTVLGMIQSFNDITNSQAMGRPDLLAGGISQALLTTAAGLLVAIPAYAIYVFFVARIDSLIIEMDTQAQRLIDGISAEGLQENEGTRGRRSRKAA